MRFIASHINARNLKGHGFRSLMDLVRQTPCRVLRYGGFDGLPADFAGRLAALFDN